MDIASKNKKQLKDKSLKITNQLKKSKNMHLNINNKKEFNSENNNNDLNYISEIKNLSINDSDYRKKLDKRIDILMNKIDENINNNKYEELNKIITNYKNSPINKNFDNKKIKEFIPNQNNKNYKDSSNKKNINNTNNINKKEQILVNNIEENEKYCDDNKMNKSAIFPSKVQIICKRENEINIRLLKKFKYLENENNYLKYKLENVEKQKDFFQSIIMNNKNIKKSLFDIFLVEYYKKIALNWKDISNEIIDELIMDEIHELSKIKLKLRNIKREKEKEEEDISNNKNISPIEIEEFKLFNDNLKGIKKVILSVKQSEKNLCKKYKVKLNNFK